MSSPITTPIRLAKTSPPLGVHPSSLHCGQKSKKSPNSLISPTRLESFQSCVSVQKSSHPRIIEETYNADNPPAQDDITCLLLHTCTHCWFSSSSTGHCSKPKKKAQHIIVSAASEIACSHLSLITGGLRDAEWRRLRRRLRRRGDQGFRRVDCLRMRVCRGREEEKKKRDTLFRYAAPQLASISS